MATAAAYALTRTVRIPNSHPNHVRTLSRCTNTPTLVLSGMTVVVTSLESMGPFRKVLRSAYSVARALAGATAAAGGLSTNALAPDRAAASAARWASVRAANSIPRSMPSARKPSSTTSVSATITITDPVSLSTIRIEARIIVPRFTGWGAGCVACSGAAPATSIGRSEEHTSKVQSDHDLVGRLLLQKRKAHDDCHTSTN